MGAIKIYWNNRVLKRIEGEGTDYEEELLYIVEMYYHEDGSILGWTNGKDVYSEDLDSLRSTLEWMLEALDKPILIETELLAEAEEARENGAEDLFPNERLSIDEVLDSLGLEREDVEPTYNEISRWEEEGGVVF